MLILTTSSLVKTSTSLSSDGLHIVQNKTGRMAPVRIAVNIVLTKFGVNGRFGAVLFQPVVPWLYISTIPPQPNNMTIMITKSRAPKKIQKNTASEILDQPSITTRQDARRQPTSTCTRNFFNHETSALHKMTLELFSVGIRSKAQ